MARLGRGGFLALAVVFHLIYIYSILDIYFLSPIVHGMQAHRVDHHTAPAKRLVLFVGDGLRADKAFQSFPDPSPNDSAHPDLTPRPLAPFLRSRVLEHGTFGVSHTRVPTESRPGHVALIAGLYEDVSAVTTGWKLNPVDFDSVFNRSRHTWSWGSPDILPMFKEGAVPGRVDADQYSEEAEDFTQDATQLDIWVFDKVKELFQEAKSNATLNGMLRQDKLVFFLHLLGLDTTGHSYRPYSKEYLHNIKVVDKGVEEIYKLIQDFYADDQTAYVFTADHGMSDWGSHGDGHPDNTRTPLIVWGSGVAKPVIQPGSIAAGHEDGFSHDWNLQHVQRHDVEQADVAALMAYLVGLEFPVNSVGALPLPYLDGTAEQKAHAALVNAKGVLEMYHIKEQKKQKSEIRYRPFSAFSGQGQTPAERLNAIQTSIDSGNFEEAIHKSKKLLLTSLEGLRYLQTYDWLFLRTLITLGYLGWMAYAATTVIDLHVLHGASASERTTLSTIIFSSILVLLYSSFLISNSPYTYYAYAFFPVFFWEEVYASRKGFFRGIDVLFGHVRGAGAYVAFILGAILYIGVLEALVHSYFHRVIFTILYVLGAFWPLSYGSRFVSEHPLLIVSWMAGCLVLSTFTLLPVVKVDNANTVTMGGSLMLAAGIIYLVFEQKITNSSRSGKKAGTPELLSRIIMGCQVGVIVLTMFVTRSSTFSLQAKQGLPLGNQIVGWLCLVGSLILPFVHRVAPNNHYLHRLVVIFLTFSPSFIILTISYEGLFYFTFSATLLLWIRLEHAVHLFTMEDMKDSSSTTRPNRPVAITSTDPPNTDLIASRTTHRALMLTDLRISLFFIFLLQSAFFSTGNIASISSFSLDAVYRLIPIFDPFSQAALLIFKILVPFACISAVLGILNRRIGLQSSALFMVVMSIGDVMTLNFFWMVKDEGSWLDIGITITNFFIGSMLSVFVAGLEGVSELLISGVKVDGFEEQAKKENGIEIVGGNGIAEPAAKNINNGGKKKSKNKGKGKREGNGEVKQSDPRPVID